MTISSQINMSSIYLGISLIGLILLPVLMLNPPQILLYVPFTRLAVGILFMGICTFGVLAALYPSQCKGVFSAKKIPADQLSSRPTIPSVASSIRRGHHPTCSSFAAHVLRLRQSILCAGCTGLALGAGIGILGSISYFLLGIDFPNASLLFVFGFSGTAFGLTQHTFYRYLPVNAGIVRTVINTFFVVSVFLLLSTTDQIARSLLVDAYLLLLIVYWVYTRIMRSQSEHARICHKCPSPTCTDQPVHSSLY